MDAVAIQRWLLGHAVALAHLTEQPLAAGAVDAGQAHHAGRDAAGQRQPLSFQHQPPGITFRLGGRAFFDPLAVLLCIHAAAGHEQQAPWALATLGQPGQHMAQTVDIGCLVTRLVVLAGRHAIHQVVRRALRPGVGDRWLGQVRRHRHDPRRQLTDRATQAAHLPAARKHLPGKTPAYITTSHHHHGKV
ncbi:hypothetical protein D3C81_1684580 [compost metagenome]